MAENKKSFILYADLISLVEKLPDEQAGKLFKIILEYVNDKNPVVDDLLLQIAFEPIKLQLKRDLKQWESERQNRSESGRLGGIRSGEIRRLKQIEANRSTASKNEANEAVTVNVTVNDNILEEAHKKYDKLKPILCNEIMSYYGFTEMRNYDKMVLINNCITQIITNSQIDLFTKNFYNYKRLRSGENIKFRVDLQKYLGSIKELYLDGVWNSENWEDKVNKEMPQYTKIINNELLELLKKSGL